MTAREILDAYCAKFGLAPEVADRFLPLVERALRAPNAVRKRVLKLVEESLAQQAEGIPRPPVELPDDDRILRVVAGVLHEWTPPEEGQD